VKDDNAGNAKFQAENDNDLHASTKPQSIEIVMPVIVITSAILPLRISSKRLQKCEKYREALSYISSKNKNGKSYGVYCVCAKGVCCN